MLVRKADLVKIGDEEVVFITEALLMAETGENLSCLCESSF